MSRLKIIVSTVREGRAADLVVPWVLSCATEHGAFEPEILDLRDWVLPIFGETRESVGDPANPTYSRPVVARWNEKFKEADAFVIVTTEYNHGIPGGLKNALDTVFLSLGLRNKPVMSVGYSSGIVGAARAIEQLALNLIEAEAVPLRNTVLIGQVASAFGEDGRPINPVSEYAMRVALDDLSWWSTVLEGARATGQLPLASARLRQMTSST